jgi:hypothetical protein
MSLNESILEDADLEGFGEVVFAGALTIHANAPRIFPAPKGHPVKAQGIALGMASTTFPSPERA